MGASKSKSDSGWDLHVLPAFETEPPFDVEVYLDHVLSQMSTKSISEADKVEFIQSLRSEWSSMKGARKGIVKGSALERFVWQRQGHNADEFPGRGKLDRDTMDQVDVMLEACHTTGVPDCCNFFDFAQMFVLAKYPDYMSELQPLEAFRKRHPFQFRPSIRHVMKRIDPGEHKIDRVEFETKLAVGWRQLDRYNVGKLSMNGVQRALWRQRTLGRRAAVVSAEDYEAISDPVSHKVPRDIFDTVTALMEVAHERRGDHVRTVTFTDYASYLISSYGDDDVELSSIGSDFEEGPDDPGPQPPLPEPFDLTDSLQQMRAQLSPDELDVDAFIADLRANWKQIDPHRKGIVSRKQVIEYVWRGMSVGPVPLLLPPDAQRKTDQLFAGTRYKNWLLFWDYANFQLHAADRRSTKATKTVLKPRRGGKPD